MQMWPSAPRTDAEMPGHRLVFCDDFDDDELDRGRWLPHYLPHWSSLAAGRATWRLGGGAIRLMIGATQAPWCPEFDGDVRVSALQTGRFSGEAGSPVGQHRYREGLRVREAQPAERLFTPRYGRIVLRARAFLDAGTLASLYLVGFEDRPEDAGEITVMEIFGRDVRPDGTVVGRGVKAIADPGLTTEFIAEALPIRPSEWHVYEADWSEDGVAFLVDGRPVGNVRQTPGYAMQLMLTFFRLSGEPEPGRAADLGFEVDYVRAYERIPPA